MAKRMTQSVSCGANPPQTLEKHIFYGLELDEEQTVFRDAIWSDNVDIVFCNANAGTGKTLISVATAMVMKEYGKIDEIVYMTAGGVHEYKQGLLPGDQAQKSRILMTPLYQALSSLGYEPERMVQTDQNIIGMKEGTSCITTITDSYIRGMNIGGRNSRALLIVDEAENMSVNALKTALTRVNNGSKVVVIGHDKQCDLKYPQDSGFVRYVEWFRGQERCAVCSLNRNYRGWISSWADKLV